MTGELFAADASDETVAAMLDAWLAGPHDAERCSTAARSEFAPSAMFDAYRRIYERHEQRLAPPSAPAAPYPEMALLRDHLGRQRNWRASSAREAAVDLAGEGRPRQALGALAIAYRAAPMQFLKRAGVRQLLSTGYRIVKRGARRQPPAAAPTGAA